MLRTEHTVAGALAAFDRRRNIEREIEEFVSRHSERRYRAETELDEILREEGSEAAQRALLNLWLYKHGWRVSRRPHWGH